MENVFPIRGYLYSRAWNTSSRLWYTCSKAWNISFRAWNIKKSSREKLFPPEEKTFSPHLGKSRRDVLDISRVKACPKTRNLHALAVRRNVSCGRRGAILHIVSCILSRYFAIFHLQLSTKRGCYQHFLQNADPKGCFFRTFSVSLQNEKPAAPF